MEKKKKKSLWTQIWQARYLYLIIAPLMIWLVIFRYGPMYGVIIAFKDFSAKQGILGSPWVGLEHFKQIFATPRAVSSIVNTLRISFERLIFQFPMGIVVAIILTEMPGRRIKKVYQTIFTFPHFLSWIIVGNILINFLSGNGVVNNLLDKIGIGGINFLGTPALFRPLLYITSNWKGMGWASIIYLAAISGIDPGLYEAAEIDGASRWQRILHITLPGIASTIAIMFILDVGHIMSAGFDQIFVMRNSLVAEQGRILDTYIYDITFTGIPNYSFSSAVGLFKSIINLFMLLTTNWVVYKLTGKKMFQ